MLLYVRPLVLLAFVLTWFSCCVGCGVKPAPQFPQRAYVDQLELETVAMVTAEDGQTRPFCAGVWVSPVAFVTAGHCVRDLGKSDFRRFQEQLAQVFDFPAPPPWDPVGQQALFEQRDDLPGRYWTGLVSAYDAKIDLALVTADEPAPPHRFARLSLASIEDGDRVAYVGHPVGSTWSYAEGYVSSSSVPECLRRNGVDVLQIAGPLSRGNSGGGLFDESGHLLGIASYMVEDMNGMGFFVHRDCVRAFLRGAGAA